MLLTSISFGTFYISTDVVLALITLYGFGLITGWLLCSMCRDAKDADGPLPPLPDDTRITPCSDCSHAKRHDPGPDTDGSNCFKCLTKYPGAGFERRDE